MIKTKKYQDIIFACYVVFSKIKPESEFWQYITEIYKEFRYIVKAYDYLRIYPHAKEQESERYRRIEGKKMLITENCNYAGIKVFWYSESSNLHKSGEYARFTYQGADITPILRL